MGKRAAVLKQYAGAGSVAAGLSVGAWSVWNLAVGLASGLVSVGVALLVFGWADEVASGGES